MSYIDFTKAMVGQELLRKKNKKQLLNLCNHVCGFILMNKITNKEANERNMLLKASTNPSPFQTLL